MITYPRIFSISTVGIRQHYNQDYLLHPSRTDFVGPNGVGKSIIGNLLQIIYIANPQHIDLGKGLKEKRVIENLPFGNNQEAYTFINIEVKPNSFFTVGACISKRGKSLITPFIVSDNKESMNNIFPYNKTKLVSWSNFTKTGNVQNDTIYKLEELYKSFEDSGLTITLFGGVHNPREEYYRYLFNHRIVGFDLRVGKNLETLATILQSFSRAGDFDPSSSNDLKDFLFGDDSNLIQENFKKYRTNLKVEMNRYNDFKNQEEELTAKQRIFKNLKELLDDYNDKKSICILAKQKYYFLKKYYEGKQLIIYQNELDELSKNQVVLQHKIDKSEIIVPKTLAFSKEMGSKRANLISAKTIIDKLKSIESQIKMLEDLTLSYTFEGAKLEEKINTYEVSSIEKIIKKATKIIEKYGSISNIENLITQQKEIISNRKKALDREALQQNRLKELVDKSSENSLLKMIVEEGKPISIERETILFYLLENGISLNKPSKPILGSRYATDLNVLKPEFISEDNESNGYWLQTGNLSEFVIKSLEEQQLGKIEDLVSIFDSIEGQVIKKIELLQNEKLELLQLEKREKNNIIEFKYLKIPNNFDFELIDYSTITELKNAYSLFCKIPDKITQLNLDKSKHELLLKTYEQEGMYSDLFNDSVFWEGFFEKQNSKYQLLWEKLVKHNSEITIQSNSNLSRISQLKNSLIHNLEEEQENTEKGLNVLNLYFPDSKDETEKKCSQLTIIELILLIKSKKESIEEINNTYENSEKEYVTGYKSTYNFCFSKNPDRELETLIKEFKYPFEKLELAALGLQIKHTDNISDALTEIEKSIKEVISSLSQLLDGVFTETKTKYIGYLASIKKLQEFFLGRKIGGAFFLTIETTKPNYSIDWIKNAHEELKQANLSGELFKLMSVDEFIKNLFEKINNQDLTIEKLLNPKTYIELVLDLVPIPNEDIDEEDSGILKIAEKVSGSTGETYAALMLLGIGRLELLNLTNANWARFIVLEEIANLDDINFELFLSIAQKDKEKYQILTMTPKPYNISNGGEWYQHRLVKSKKNKLVNLPMPVSYFKTSSYSEDLQTYLNREQNELDSSESIE
jgi:DNA repair protein SbcC/Rad50